MTRTSDNRESNTDADKRERITAEFRDAASAQLAAESARRDGFDVETRGATTLVVRSRAQSPSADEARGILRAYGGTEVAGVTASAPREPDLHAATSVPASTSANDTSAPRAGTDEAVRVELREEELRPETRPVVTGEVVIRRQVVTETRTIKVPITREEIVIERHPVEHQAVDQVDAATSDPVIRSLLDRLRELQPGDVLRIPIIEEEVTISKQPVVVEEITVRKRLQEDTQRFSETVRREVAQIESTGSVRINEGNSTETGGAR